MESILKFALTSIDRNCKLIKRDQNIILLPGEDLKDFYSSQYTTDVLNDLITLLRAYTNGSINIGDENFQVSGSVYCPVGIPNKFIDIQSKNRPFIINLYCLEKEILEPDKKNIENLNHYPEINIVFKMDSSENLHKIILSTNRSLINSYCLKKGIFNTYSQINAPQVSEILKSAKIIEKSF